MTHEQAERRAAELNADRSDVTGHWMAQRIDSDWRVVKIAGAVAGARDGLTASTQQRPKPDYAPDPRPLNEQNVPPLGAGG